ncbi:unnamed protein product [Symbiodinium necroappetens]|uniref:C3H1-type domain-containing protein n=1 Tax=Symbiodinium necroappetens TaxID=1628268 RepID=A0A813CIN7_9DINO|nr:unnamed protein product [Symbiodinium necroappetens]
MPAASFSREASSAVELSEAEWSTRYGSRPGARHLRQMRASQSTPELHQLERAPSGGLAFRASQRSLEGDTPAVGNKLDLRRRAAEIVALNSLYAQSSSGSLQHAAIPRIRHVLEARDELLAEQASENRVASIAQALWAEGLGSKPAKSCDMNQLILKSTFLSVQARPATSCRARSAPPQGRPGAASKQGDYVAGLVQRASSLNFLEAEVETDKKDQTKAAGRTVNPGTLGHPQLCCRPCVYLVIAGSCRNGEECEYCHEPHDARVPKLDKQQRQLLRTLNEADTLGLLLPYLTEKARSMPPIALELVSQLERHLASLDSATGTVISNARLVKLAHVLQKMSFIRVLCLMPTVWSTEVKTLLAELRRAYICADDQIVELK